MSNISSFLSGSSNPTTEFTKIFLADGNGNLQTFSNNTSGYLYGIQFGIIQSYFNSFPSATGDLVLNTAISGQSNVALSFSAGSVYGSDYKSMENFGLISNYYRSDLSPARICSGAYMPLETRFSGQTTISVSGNSSPSTLANIFCVILFYDLD